MTGASLRARYVAAQLPQRDVVLAPVVAGAPPDRYTVRALRGDLWDALEGMHPPTDEQREQGWQWNPATFRPALLAACVVTPDGEEPLTEHEWADLLMRTPIGDRDRLFVAALEVNDNAAPGADVGKGSG